LKFFEAFEHFKNGFLVGIAVPDAVAGIEDESVFCFEWNFDDFWEGCDRKVFHFFNVSVCFSLSRVVLYTSFLSDDRLGLESCQQGIIFKFPIADGPAHR
jgi:hypothetical protein